MQNVASGRRAVAAAPLPASVEAAWGAPTPKKLVIRAFRHVPKLPDDFYEENWSELLAALRAIQAGDGQCFSREELFRKVEDVCLHDMAARLYGDLEREMDRHLAEALAVLPAPETVPAYRPVLAAWKQHCRQTQIVGDIFLYLDRTYAVMNTNVRSLGEMARALFAKHLLAHDGRVLRPTIASALQAIEKDRRGEPMERAELRDLLVDMLDTLGFYRTEFEPQLFATTRAFYAAEGRHYVAERSLPEYLGHCEMRLQQEQERVQAYLDASSQRQLLAILNDALGRQCVEAMMDKGLEALFDETRVDDLGRLYQLLRRIDATWKLTPRYGEYIKRRCAAITLDEEHDADMVKNLLALHERAELMERDAFRGDKKFHNAAQTAFEAAINLRQNVPAELLARHFDQLLRAGNKAYNEEQLNEVLSRLMELFRFLNGKDVFEAFYKSHLAKRLLLGRSASIDWERSVVARLRTECGASFTNHLENMFKDMDVSADLMQAFEQRRQRRNAPALPPIQFHCQVLTQAYWPCGPPLAIKLPESLQRCQDAFARFYLSKHSGRRLAWHSAMSTCELRARFPRGEKTLSVSLHQALVLLQFNDADALPYTAIREHTGIFDDRELKRTLQSLACGKARVLQKEPRGRDVHDTDRFAFHTDFTDPHYRIRINQIQSKESQEEQRNTSERVFQDRQYQIDAAIVRIMKARRRLSHAQLIGELYAQLPFPHKPADLKRRIESLIQREYLARDDANPNAYRYVA
ncbi:hypothetical protein CDCA_CDCA09G2634 [Cyanidium caldarium]|uniref:Cullin family profile domain-containing protein n=1 Tax=Cyanidium caldarium TaxID=2771 RepID=A0AAV9IWF8_CYACA|nr:hypothetical protein CDCA_CDCA09G2634 [Cyanidium caldarium]